MSGQGSPLASGFVAAVHYLRPLALDRRQATTVAALSALFVVQCWMPIRPAGIFRDLVDAPAILREGALPTADPLLPYADHERFAVLNPVGSLIEFGAWNVAGASGLVLLTAALSTATIGLWTLWAVRRHDSWSAALPTIVWTLAVAWGSYDAAGTTRFGLVLLPLLFVLLDASRVWKGEGAKSQPPPRTMHRLSVAAVPALFAVWVTLDASWVIGLSLLWIVAAGRAAEIVLDRRAGRASGASSVSLPLATALLSTLATLANPYGWKLWGLLSLPPAIDPFVATLGPLEPLAAWSLTGVLAAIVLAAAGRCLAKSYARFGPAESVSIAACVAASFAFPDARLWALPLAGALVLPPVWREALERLDRYRVHRPRPERVDDFSGAGLAPTGVALCSIIGALALTPAIDGLFGRSGETLASVVVDAPLEEVPVDAFDAGIVFAPPWWSDAFAFQAIAAGKERPAPRLLADSRQATLPPSVRQDVDRILRGEEGWAAILDRFETKTLLLDPRRQSELAELVRAEPRWRETSSSDSLLVFRREERVR